MTCVVDYFWSRYELTG